MMIRIAHSAFNKESAGQGMSSLLSVMQKSGNYERIQSIREKNKVAASAIAATATAIVAGTVSASGSDSIRRSGSGSGSEVGRRSIKNNKGSVSVSASIRHHCLEHYILLL